MRVIIYILLYMLLTAVYFFTLSLFGSLWLPYEEIITDKGWFAFYFLFFHWWLVILSLNEYYEKYVKNVF